jgi:hypothetical protein
VPSLARANSYHDFLCRIPYGPQVGRVAPADDVTYATTPGAPWLYSGDGCAGGGSLYAAMDGGVPHPYGVSALNTFSAPAGLTIAGFTVWRYEADTAVQPYGAPASNLLYSPGPPSVEGLCAQSLGCASRGTPSNPFDPSNAVSVGSLGDVTLIQWSAACGGGPGGECPASGSGTLSSQYNVYAADIDLVDNTPPAVNGVSGPLVAGGTLSGTQAISFNASDGQSGVYSGSLLVDGHAVSSQILDTNGGACQSLNVTKDGQRSFEHAQPCKPSVSASLTLNASALAAGQHALELIVNDAAGNQTIGYNGTITVSGPPLSGGPGGAQIGPGSPLALRGALNGTNASDQAKLTAHWIRTRKVALTSSYGVRSRISGTLTTLAGQPVSDAMIDVYETPAYQGAPARQIGDVSTGSTGKWTLVLGGNLSSSALSLRYRSHVNDTIPVATAALSLRVHAGITLKIAPRSVSVGRKIFFSGVLHGTPIPSGGKQLVLEASSGGEWIQFDTIRTDVKGRYHASYRFRFPGPATYRFRVLSRYEADFPFIDGTSRNIAVHEH